MAVNEQWHIPITQDDISLQMALDSLSGVRTTKNETSLMIKLVEQTKNQRPELKLFSTGFDLFQHDCIQIILGRGLSDIDEAFAFGFTLGCAKKSTSTEYNLYAFVSQRLNPDVYSFNEQEMAVMKEAIKLAYISSCVALDRFDFSKWLDEPIRSLRDVLGIEPELLLAYYAVEKRRYPKSLASQRLLPDEQIPMVY